MTDWRRLSDELAGIEAEANWHRLIQDFFVDEPPQGGEAGAA